MKYRACFVFVLACSTPPAETTVVEVPSSRTVNAADATPPLSLYAYLGGGQVLRPAAEGPTPLRLLALDGEGRAVIGLQVAWSSAGGVSTAAASSATTDGGVAETQVIAGEQAGSFAVSASAASVMAEFPISVIAAQPAALTLTKMTAFSAPRRESLDVAVADARDAFGNAASLTGLTFETSDASVATVDASGATVTVTGVGPGAVVITARLGELSVTSSMASPRAIDIAAGDEFACAIVEGGAVYCWGTDRGRGVLGQPGAPIQVEPRPVRVALPDGFVAARVFASVDAACALSDTRALRCWGTMEGVDEHTPGESYVPPGVEGKTVTAVSVGDRHACAVDAEGDAFCWGSNEAGELGRGYSSIEEGAILAVDRDGAGRVFAGSDGQGLFRGALDASQWTWARLDTGDADTSIRAVAVVNGDLFCADSSGRVLVSVDDGATFADASVASNHVHGLARNGGRTALFAYGQAGAARWNAGDWEPLAGAEGAWVSHMHVAADGSLYLGGFDGLRRSRDDGDTFEMLEVEPGVSSDILAVTTATDVIAVLTRAFGAYVSYHLWLSLDDGVTFSAVQVPYGDGNPFHALATTHDEKIAVGFSNGVFVVDPATMSVDGGFGFEPGTRSLHADSDFIVAGASGGRISVVSASAFDTFGVAPLPESKPVLRSDGVRYTAVHSVGPFTCLVTDAGAVRCLGYNQSDALGNAFAEDALHGFLPSALTFPSGAGPIVQLHGGSTFTCAIDVQGAMFCWGENYSGKLGLGTDNHSVRDPIAPLAEAGVTFVVGAGSGQHQCVVTGGGDVRCAGISSYLGVSAYADAKPFNVSTLEPASVSNGRTLTKVATAASSTCALASTGVIYCWGECTSAECGEGTGRTGSGLTAYTPYAVELP